MALNKKGDLAAKVFASKTTALADFIFTLPSVIIQPITGIMLIKIVGYDYTSLWLVLTYIGYVIPFPITKCSYMMLCICFLPLHSVIPS